MTLSSAMSRGKVRAVPLGIAALAAAIAVVAAACGGGGATTATTSSSSTSTTAAGGADTGAAGKPIKLVWILYGPKNDGGWNLSHRAAEAPIQQKFGDSVQQIETDNVPFTQDASQITQRFIDDGATLIIDTAALGDYFTKVCAKNPGTTCLENLPISTLSQNTSGYYGRLWVSNYIAGVAAGLTTKTHTIGFVSPYDLPISRSAINSYALGCQSIHPDCKVRVITVNNYFDPPKTAQAANSLIDAGADVLRGFVDDPSYCRVAQQRGVHAVAEFFDASSQCPGALITSTVWNWTDYYISQIQQLQAGTWTQSNLTYIPSKQLLSLGPFGSSVPADVKTKLTKTFDDVISGTLNPFVGPIYDSAGALKVPQGQKLSDAFLYGDWKWYAKGVIAGN